MKLEWDFSEFEEFANKLSNVSNFENHIQNATKRLAKALLGWMKSFTPVDTYELIRGWDGNDFAVQRVKNGFEVLIVNKCEYASAVNDGHKAYNQYGGPYPIKKRIQVRNSHPWQKGDPTYYVFGHFFVERGILRLCSTSEIEQILMQELEKWWEGCF
jgi:hypothetical protein